MTAVTPRVKKKSQPNPQRQVTNTWVLNACVRNNSISILISGTSTIRLTRHLGIHSISAVSLYRTSYIIPTDPAPTFRGETEILVDHKNMLLRAHGSMSSACYSAAPLTLRRRSDLSHIARPHSICSARTRSRCCPSQPASRFLPR